MEINGEKQKSFAEILPEIIITKKMSSLQANANNSTDGFVNIHKATLVRGKYPHHLIQLWEKYDSEKNSENDHPRVFAVNQLYLVLELEFAGNDMSNFKFTNAEQSYFVLQQIILSLAIGEEECQFEHRDLHWGNVLIKDTKKKDIYFKFMNNDLTLPSKGVKISIIDYTLSRITIGQSCYFNDLSSDEDLFSATGDYQYDIYRMMRNELKNNWASFSPKTNILWLSYLVSKLLKGVNYKCVNSKIHRQHIKKLKELQNNMLSYDSAATCVKNMFRLT
ncbi:putative serine/threonine-protein kinase haspin homolog isoform X4 [Drosophila serrata]|nr:putative serine/threonine-protein kinase haspin homolog isoform X4 [Drosophila serrata]